MKLTKREKQALLDACELIETGKESSIKWTVEEATMRKSDIFYGDITKNDLFWYFYDLNFEQQIGSRQNLILLFLYAHESVE